MTDPSRLGREDQASLTAMGAESLAWNYDRLLMEILSSAQPLADIRKINI